MTTKANEADLYTIIHTDGGCRGNPGLGGWGAVLQVIQTSSTDRPTIRKELDINGAERHTTNNRMELMAAIESLKHLTTKSRKVIVVSDSQYLVKGMSEWIDGWKRRGWKTGDRKPVQNADLWQQLDSLAQSFSDLRWKWVKGHSASELNERADRLANMAMDDLATATATS